MITFGYENSGDLFIQTNTFDKLVKKLFKNIKIYNSNESDIIIKAPLSGDIWNTNKIPYIYWSGENRNPTFSNYHTKYLEIATLKSTNLNSLYIPFCLESKNIYKERIDKNLDRKFSIGYCASNYVNIREMIYSKFVERFGPKNCCAFGTCYGNYKETQYFTGGDYNGESIISNYNKCKFILALENSKGDGYITEKIVNAFYSGAIPIYYGDSNINNFFNKEAFINIDGFENIDVCVDYVSNLSDEKRKYMLEQPIYTNNELINIYNDNYNLKNDNKILKQYEEIIKKFFFFNKIFILCNKSIELQRYENMEKQITNANIDKSNIEYTYKFWNTDIEDFKFKNNNNFIYENNLYQNLNNAEISLLINHINILKCIKEKYTEGIFLILESDAYVFEGMEFTDIKLIELINISHKLKDWDIINIGGTCIDIFRNDGYPKNKGIEINNFTFYNEDRLICIESLIWNYNSICKFLDLFNIYNFKNNNIISVPIDVIIDNLVISKEINIYWTTPCLLKQGSGSIFKSLLR
jgi:hypothetical protein